MSKRLYVHNTRSKEGTQRRKYYIISSNRGYHAEWIIPSIISLCWGRYISTAQCKTAVTPVLTHWSYCSLTLCYSYARIFIVSSKPSNVLWVNLHTFQYSSDLFYRHGLTLIPAWISNHMRTKVWDEITYPFSNFNVMQSHDDYCIGCNYLSMLGLMLIHVSKRVPRY